MTARANRMDICVGHIGRKARNASTPFPSKNREIHNHHFDSTVWNDFLYRTDDVVIATYAKSGTTLVQQIVGQLIFDGAEGVPVAEISPWLDLRVPKPEVKLALLEAQKHRRFIKTHLPVDGLVFSPVAKYIYIGRDGRDVVWSLHNHHLNANKLWYEMLNDTPGRVGPPIRPPPTSKVRYFEDWLDRDGFPFWPFWENVRSWWNVRRLPNVLILHYGDIIRDKRIAIERISEFLGIRVSKGSLTRIMRHCSFDYMKRNGDGLLPLSGAFWDGGARTFVHKGVNGRWRSELPEALSTRYEEVATTQLGAGCAAWLQFGEFGASVKLSE